MKNNFLDNLRNIHGKIYEFNTTWEKEIYLKAREKRNFFERKKLKIEHFTIISNTCIGGVISHDLGRPFLSPTVNIYIRPREFVQFCENIHYYLTLPLIEVPYDERIGYPVAMLGDIVLYCKHYRSFDEAKEAWERRKLRIDWEHIYFIMADRDLIPPSSLNESIYACDEKIIQRFDLLSFKNKICIVKNPIYSERYTSCRRLLKGCDKNCVGILTDIMNITGKRMYQYVENFDYIQFLNDGVLPDEK